MSFKATLKTKYGRTPAANPPEGPDEFVAKMQKLKADKGIEAVVAEKRKYGPFFKEHNKAWKESLVGKEAIKKRNALKAAAHRKTEKGKAAAQRTSEKRRYDLKTDPQKRADYNEYKRNYQKTPSGKEQKKRAAQTPKGRASHIRRNAKLYRKGRLIEMSEGVEMPRVQNRPTEGSEKKLVKGRKHGDIKVDPKNIDYGGKMGPIKQQPKGGTKAKFSKVLRKMKGGIGSPLRFGMKPSKKE